MTLNNEVESNVQSGEGGGVGPGVRGHPSIRLLSAPTWPYNSDMRKLIGNVY